MKASIALVLAGLAIGSAAAAPTDEVKALLEQNKPKQAYELGRANPGLLGNPTFDFYFGIAAIDAGRPGEGVLALERYLLQFPQNPDARFQLGRGYFVLGEDQRARDEFEALLPEASGDMKLALERYLNAIRAREARYQPTASFYVEAGLSTDSNINAGLNAGATPSIPGLGNLPALDPNSVSAKQHDWFMSLAAGAQGSYPLEPGLSLFGAAGMDAKQYLGSNNDLYDQISLGGTGGVAYLKDKNLFKAGLSLSQIVLDDQRYLFTYGFNGEWNHQFNQFNRFTLGGQFARLQYDDMKVFLNRDKSGGAVTNQTSIRDSDLVGVSGAWTHAYNLPYQPVVSASISYAQERNQHNRTDLSRDITGARLGLALTPAQRWGVSAGISFQDNVYQGDFTAGSERRRDHSWGQDLALSYFYNTQLSVRAELQNQDQSSNIGLFEYRRHMVGVKARYEFK